MSQTAARQIHPSLQLRHTLSSHAARCCGLGQSAVWSLDIFPKKSQRDFVPKPRVATSPTVAQRRRGNELPWVCGGPTSQPQRGCGQSGKETYATIGIGWLSSTAAFKMNDMCVWDSDATPKGLDPVLVRIPWVAPKAFGTTQGFGSESRWDSRPHPFPHAFVMSEKCPNSRTRQ